MYRFGDGKADGTREMKKLLGGKGANLAEMALLGLPVPPGFTITTEVCTAFYKNAHAYPAGLSQAVEEGIAHIETVTGKTFGDAVDPLLVSVRSGARASMPGMMDTVLNLGLNDESVTGLAALTGDERFAYDSYRRFIQMYANVVLQMDHSFFEDILEECKRDRGVHLDTELTAMDWRTVINGYKGAVRNHLGTEFPHDPREQLWGATDAVFRSWMNDRSRTYRRLNRIPEDWGTAVNIQAMVFGNMGETSATGVAFTRNPSNGENQIYGEFLKNAQGEDVVAGIRTPSNLTKRSRIEMGSDAPSLEECMPETYQELIGFFERLESHYRDMQDIEFTVQEGKLWLLQTRTGKRTAKAAIKIATDLCKEGIISMEEAVMRVEPESLDQLLHPSLAPSEKNVLLTRGLPASPGAAAGSVVFTADEAEEVARDGTKIILVRDDTSPEDIHGMHAAAGIVTARGGMTSHAAVVARGMGRACVSGAGEIRFAPDRKSFTVGSAVIKKGDIITIDGSTGEVFLGEIPTIPPEMSEEFETLMNWADSLRRMGIRANAETPVDARRARAFGAEGIGLCRTEHMFFDPERILAVQEMILAETQEDRTTSLSRLLDMQRLDFYELFLVMKSYPVTIRLLDPPLHEFLPQADDDIRAVARASGVDISIVYQRIKDLNEVNPMLGHRGCRLGVTYPDIYEMQVRAILEAACDTVEKTGVSIAPEIMIPLVSVKEELTMLKARIDDIAAQVFAARGRMLDYHVGTMIELPRAALVADQIAEEAEFFSFGTNDLTQTTFGLSRDDAGAFLPAYQKAKVMPEDPFVTLDRDGVGTLMRIAAEKGRATRRSIKLGLCGEHGGDPRSIDFCEMIGLDYVSCSPYRVPVARLAAAQAAIKGST
nr:pyruvate, phosphate dikinase [Aquisalinus flavus]